jgi:hypothetical protein
VAGGWRRLQNEELHNLYASPNIIGMNESRRMIWAGHVARIMEMSNVYKISVGKPEGKRLPGRRNSIRMGLREIEWDGLEWIYLAQDRDQ